MSMKTKGRILLGMSVACAALMAWATVWNAESGRWLWAAIDFALLVLNVTNARNTWRLERLRRAHEELFGEE